MLQRTSDAPVQRLTLWSCERDNALLRAAKQLTDSDASVKTGIVDRRVDLLVRLRRPSPQRFNSIDDLSPRLVTRTPKFVYLDEEEVGERRQQRPSRYSIGFAPIDPKLQHGHVEAWLSPKGVDELHLDGISAAK